jgi:hypothetical protein
MPLTPQEISVSPSEVKILGKTASAIATIEKFGGQFHGNPAQTTNLSQLQENFDDGFALGFIEGTFQKTDGTTTIVKIPTLQELAGLFYTMTALMRSLQQNPLDFVQNQTYRLNAFVKSHQTTFMYQSVIDYNTGADLNADLYSNTLSYDIDIFVKSTSGHIYKSLVASNLNNPLTDTSKWKKVWHFVVDYTKFGTYLTTFNEAEKLVQTNSNNKISNTLLNDATTTIAGIIELATQTEVNVGTDSLRAITPATLQNSKINFYANNIVDQTIGNLVFSKINLPNTLLNVSNYFNTTTSRFTPLVAGWYLFGYGIQVPNGDPTGLIASAYLAKNGIGIVETTMINSGASVKFGNTTIAYANGTTDYFELYARLNGANATIIAGGVNNTFLYAIRLSN